MFSYILLVVGAIVIAGCSFIVGNKLKRDTFEKEGSSIIDNHILKLVTDRERLIREKNSLQRKVIELEKRLV